MKKAPLLIALLTVGLVLTACGSPSAQNNGFSNNTFRSSTGGTRALNPESKLALGTIKLEGTKLAVDPKMAAKLIPLWQLMVQLNSSSSSAPQEVTAVTDQIKATMTLEQLNTINTMTLSQADIFAVFQEQAQASGSGGTARAGGNGFSSRNRGGGNGGVFVFGGGGPGGGGFGGGGPGGPGGGFAGGGIRNGSGTGANSGATSQTDAAQAAQAAQARQNATSSLLIDQLIKLLETKLRS